MTILVHSVSMLDPDKFSLLPDVNIVIEGDEIAWIGQSDVPDQFRIDEHLDAANMLVIPGLIDPHTHSQHALQKGRLKQAPIEMWLPLAAAAGGYLSEREAYICAMVGCIDYLKNGTTAILDHFAGTIDAFEGTVKAYRDAGIRAFVGPMVTDMRPHRTLASGDLLPRDIIDELEQRPLRSPQALLDSSEERIQRFRDDDRINIIIAPNHPARCSDALLVGCAELAEQYDIAFHSHLHETRWSALAAQEIFGTTLVERLHKLGILSSRMSFAHGVWLTEKEIEILADRHVTIVHLPWSNLWLGSGIADVPQLLEKGVSVAIGTDGVSGGTGSNLFDGIRMTVDLHNIRNLDDESWLTPARVWRMVIEGGATSVHASESIGSLEAGKNADMVLLDMNTTTFKPLNDALSQMVYFENGSSVHTVIIGGKVIVEDRKIITFDEKAILDEAQAIVDSLNDRTATDVALAERIQGYYRDYYRRKITDSAMSGW